MAVDRLRWFVAGATALFACGGSDDHPATAPSVSFTMAASTDGTPAEYPGLPLTGIGGTWTDEVLIAQAAYAATADCMADLGFDMPAFEIGPARYPPEEPFGPWTADDIADGYGLRTDSDRPRDDDAPLSRFTAAMPPSERQAWSTAYGGANPFGGGRHTTVTLPDGTEKESGFAPGYETGCLFHGYDVVFGGYNEREAIRTEIEAMRNDAHEDAVGSDLVDRALDVWQDCMEAQGIDVADGADGPRGLQYRYYEEPGVSDEERAAAAQDIRCKAEANLHDIYFAARAAAEQAQIEDHQIFVEAWREQRDASLARAREIVATGGG